MDISTNPEMADAAPAPHQPPEIFRKDYTPPAWLIPEVSLDFALDDTRTKVTSVLKVTRNPAADTDPNLRLNGDGLEAVSILVDGAADNSWTMDGGDLLISLPGEKHEITIVTEINPSENTQLMGLFASGGMLCTQCEAEGFRRITFFPDRPDVLSVYTVRMAGSKAKFPILLANGNNTASGENADGTHWAEWHDPWPKPSYLFALVAGDLVANSDSFTTMNGRKVELNIWVREGDEGRTQHAMDSLIRSMKWDEETFGREYDLDLFNIVAVSDFNMGAMENKGLNIFNTKYILADPDTATDGDFDGVEGVVAHEYFHNWSGNRVTCRDWFQLSLKEGFTVLRDQLFSQDMGSEPVKRIEDVRILRLAQFPEDSGPLAHPIRPDSFREISNFYTSTIYNKGAEVIRMMRTMCGEEAFRKGCDLYFERHDGDAATCEDFVSAIEDGAGIDLTQFRRWYSQAGTPKVSIRLEHSGQTAQLHMKQQVPATPGQPDKAPMPIPLKIALFDRTTGKHYGEHLVTLSDAEATLSFDGFTQPPVLSVNRGFSAPISVEREMTNEDLVFLAARDDDPFARYEAMQDLVVGYLVAASGGGLSDADRTSARASIGEAFGAILSDEALDDEMRGELMILPSQTYIAEQSVPADPAAIHDEREGLKAWLGAQFTDELMAMHQRASAVPYSMKPEARGARKLKTQGLIYLSSADPVHGAKLAKKQFDEADNMTDRQGALMVLCGLDQPQREEALAAFHKRYDGNALAIDKWFALQASSLHPDALKHVKALAEHPDFTMTNPNRVRSLYMAFAGNPQGYHGSDGAGYELIGDVILALDPINAQTAARFVPALGKWRKFEPKRSAMMKAQLERIMKADKLSRDTLEQVTRSLG
ncbi:aminopeptidase N [Altererythrobacter sp. ZODW24]|uniref:aminopeptidase N n=1 Tax=Altererythrobacter sp. ZODW24 TaxID=2185142 RepID=UPI000DF78F7D|nr:aminopeptidase N [Altererythrobacter sp. ZODW24]